MWEKSSIKLSVAPEEDACCIVGNVGSHLLLTGLTWSGEFHWKSRVIRFPAAWNEALF